MTEPATISIDQFLAHPPARVWKAITEADQMAAWWAAGDIRPEVGHHFTLDMQGWGQVPCEVLEVVPGERFAFRFTDDWVITWRLVPEGRGTRLFLEHSGFDLDRPQQRFAFDNMGPGWRDEVLPRLVDLLESQPA